MDAWSIYAEGRDRVIELVAGLDQPDLDRPVPATPGWSVKDVVGHLTGVAADLAAGRLEQAGTPSWTAHQVEAHRSVALGSVLDEWKTVTPTVRAALAGAPPASTNHLVCDLACHEHDLRGALDRPGARDAESVDLALQVGVAHLDRRLRQSNGPGLRLEAAETEWIVGPGEPVATVRAGPFPLFRSLFGRRSRAQMAALDWTGDREPYLDQLPLFAPAVEDIDE